MLIRKRIAVVAIQRAVALGSRIDIQSEGATWNFIYILDDRLLGNNAPAFYENWKRIESRIEFNLFSARDLCASPEVIPIAYRQRDRIFADKVPRLGSNQKVFAEHEFAIVQSQIALVWEFHEHRPHQRHAGPGRLLHARVDVRQETISGLDVATADCLVLRSIHPRLAEARFLGSMVAINGIERAQFHPPRK